jgi:predicted transcriptional regulator
MVSINTPVLDVLDVLVQRTDYLACVLDGPREKPALVDELDVSRSTVERATDTLETVNLVESSDNGYQTTSTGNLVATDFFDLIDSVEEVYQECERGNDVSPRAVLEAVTRRLEFLESLAEKPKDKRMLVDELEVSRTTTDRGVRELETVGLVEYADGRFALTAIGEVAVFGLFDLLDTIKLRRELDPILRWVPAGTLDIDLELLADAEIFLPEPGNPWAMVNRHVQVLKEADDGCAMLPLTGLHACEALHSRIINEGAVVELVVEPNVADTFQSNPEYAELVDEMLATDRHDIYVYDGDIPYFIGVFNETAQMGVDSDGEPRAMLETDSPEVVDWVEQKYDAYKQQSQKLA